MVSPFFVPITYIETRTHKSNITITILIITTYQHKTSHTHIPIPGSIPLNNKDIYLYNNNDKDLIHLYLILQNRHPLPPLIPPQLTPIQDISCPTQSHTHPPLDIYPLQTHPTIYFQHYGGEGLLFAASAQDTLRSARHPYPLRARDHRHLKKDKKRDTRCQIMTQMPRFLMLFVALGYSELSSSVANQK